MNNAEKIISDSIHKLFKDSKIYFLNHYLGYLIKIPETNKSKLLEDLSLVPAQVLEQVVNKQAFLLVPIHSESGEGFLDRVYKNLIILNKIPSSQVIVLSGSRDYISIANNKAEQYGVDPVKIVIFDFYEYAMKNRLLQDDLPKTDNLQQSIVSPLLKSDFKKIYLNLNYTWRPHRLALITSLYSSNLLDCGYNSFIGKGMNPLINFTVTSNDDQYVKIDNSYESFVRQKLAIKNKHDEIWLENIIHCLNNFDEPLRSTIISGANIIDILPMFLDHPTQALYSKYFTDTRYVLPFIKNSIFSLVTEAFFSKNDPFDFVNNKHCRFFTEKTFRPIAYKHPFILVTMPYSLRLLRDMGYQTFDGIINEDYDKEEDDTKRILMILDEIKRWKNMTVDQINELRKKMIPIVEHNFHVFITRKEYIYVL